MSAAKPELVAGTAVVAERFMALFAGLERAYGEMWVPKGTKADGRGKIEAVYKTARGRTTAEVWLRHLNAEIGLGIFPLRDDGFVRFASIDLDIYPIDVLSILTDVRRLGLPLIPCRSKSGGAHWHAFFADHVPAALAQSKLRNWAAALGHPNAEIFPKHTKLGEGCPDGNYINMPYFAGDRSLRYAYGDDGKALTPEGFLDAAERMRISAAKLRAWPTLAPAIPALAAGCPAPDPGTIALEEDFGEYEGAGFEDVGEDELWRDGKGEEFWRKLAEGPGPGQRHNAVKHLAALLFGLLPEMTLAEVLVRLFAEHQCDPPFGKSLKERRELNDIIKWVAKREMRNG